MAKVDITREPGESDAEYRRRYWRTWDMQRRRAAGAQPKKKSEGPCSVEGCEKPAEIKGMCGNHYRSDRVRRMKAEGLNPLGRKQGHPLYRIWWERKDRDGLCEEWLDFDTFVEGVGERPSENHYLVRVIDWEPYGPQNFKWQLFLKREKEEGQSEWWARKWQDRKRRVPDLDIGCHLVRDFGITKERYDEMLEEQGGVCFICKEVEANGKSLSVDHHHDTNTVRDLLCFACNTAFGHLRESPELIRSMLAYAERWIDPLAQAQALNRPERVLPNAWEIYIETEWGRLTISEAARRAGLPPAAVHKRYAAGWPEERLLAPLRITKRSRNQTSQPVADGIVL